MRWLKQELHKHSPPPILQEWKKREEPQYQLGNKNGKLVAFFLFFFFSFYTSQQRSSGCPDCHWFSITKFPLVIVFRGGSRWKITYSKTLGFHFTEMKVLRDEVWEAHTKRLRPELSAGALPSPSLPTLPFQWPGRRMADPDRNWESAERGDKCTFSAKPGAAEVGTQAAKPTSHARLASQGRQVLSDPAASPALPARPREAESRCPGLPATPRFFAPTLIISPAGSPGRAGCLFPPRCDHRFGFLHCVQGSRRWLQRGREGGGIRGSRGEQWHHRRGRAWGARSLAALSRQPQGHPDFRFGCGHGESLAAGGSIERHCFDMDPADVKWNQNSKVTRHISGSAAKRRGLQWPIKWWDSIAKFCIAK